MEKTKRGPKPKPYVTSWNETVNGLRKRSDGRWEIGVRGKTFVEPDERKAVAKAKRITHPVAFEGQIGFGSPIKVTHEDLDTLAAGMGTEPQELLQVFEASEPAFWKRVAEEIRTRPKWVAEQTGIEEIAYLTKLKAPVPAPTPSQLRKAFEEHFDGSLEQKKKVLKAWDHFVSETEIETTDEITPDTVIAYRDVLHDSGFKGKTQSHFIGGIRRVITLALSRNIGFDELKRVQTHLAPELLYASEPISGVPSPLPVSPEDFHKMLAKAEGQEKAFLLMALNCALYVKETVAIEWSDIKNNCLATRRKKTGQCVRVAVLWPETIAALDTLPRKRNEIFVTYQGLAFKVCGAFRMFKRITDRAGVEVTGSQLRDGAYTAAVEANIQPQLVNIFVGHSSGLDDRYVLASPKIVKPCTDAVYAHYMLNKG